MWGLFRTRAVSSAGTRSYDNPEGEGCNASIRVTDAREKVRSYLLRLESASTWIFPGDSRQYLRPPANQVLRKDQQNHK